MKYLLTITLVLLTMTMSGQQPEDGEQPSKMHHSKKRLDFTPEQIAELRTKSMTLQLDLSESQASEVYQIHLEAAQKRKANRNEGKSRKEMSSDDLFKSKSAALDQRISTKNKMKSILSPEQFAQFEESRKKQSKQKLRKQRRHRKSGSHIKPSKN